jgi:EpsD family peptidyl-prolyl cis-trans isomerase
MLTLHPAKLILTALTLPLLVACTDGDKTKAASQIAARVNGEEISVYQLDHALSHADLTEESQVKQATPLLLEHLIDQSVIVQQAKADKLDRDPAILMVLENAKRQILTEAWLQRQMKNENKPSAQDIGEFNSAHPELFEKRKIYQLKELLIERTAENQQQIDQLIESTADVNGLAEKLEAQKISFKANQVTLAAEQLPLERLPLLFPLSNGHYIKMMTENGLFIQGVLSAKDSPIEKAKATSFIETFLLNNQRKKQTEAIIKRLHDTAKIEYLGEFAKLTQADGQINQEKQALLLKKAEPSAHEDIITKGAAGL